MRSKDETPLEFLDRVLPREKVNGKRVVDENSFRMELFSVIARANHIPHTTMSPRDRERRQWVKKLGNDAIPLDVYLDPPSWLTGMWRRYIESQRKKVRRFFRYPMGEIRKLFETYEPVSDGLPF